MYVRTVYIVGSIHFLQIILSIKKKTTIIFIPCLFSSVDFISLIISNVSTWLSAFLLQDSTCRTLRCMYTWITM